MLNTCKSNGFLQNTAETSGKRVSNAQVNNRQEGDNPPKGGLIPHMTTPKKLGEVKAVSQDTVLDDVPASYQAVGEVTAHQTDDGYPV